MRFLALMIALMGCGDDRSNTSPDVAKDVAGDTATSDIGLAEDSPDSSGAGDPLSWEVAEAGPFNTGHHLIEYTYQPIEGFDRTIHVNVWYPTLATEGPHPKYLGVVRDDVTISGAAAAAPVFEKFPVHVHSHGDRGFGATSIRLVRHFVSHGWVVVAPDHAQNTAFDNVQPRPVPLYHWRTQDISQALNAVARPASSPVAGLLDTDRVLMSGHSYGAFTAWPLVGMPWDMEHVQTACAESVATTGCTDADLDVFEAGARDTRIVAAIGMAGSPGMDWMGDDVLSAPVPVMTMSGSDDPIGQEDLWARVTDTDYTWIDIDGACHQAFALGGCALIPTEEADSIIHAYALSFGRAQILGDVSQAAVLSGVDRVSERVRFEKK